MNPEITKKIDHPNVADAFNAPSGKNAGFPFVKWFQHTPNAAMPRSASTIDNLGDDELMFGSVAEDAKKKWLCG